MTLRHLRAAAPIAIAAAALALASEERPVLRPGQTLRLELAPGDPGKAAVSIALAADEDGPLTVETRTLHFDTLLLVFEGTATDARPLAEDDDGGLGGASGNSRLTFAAAAGRAYRVEVRSPRDTTGGPLEVSAARGSAPPVEAAEQRGRDAAYWDAVAAEAGRTGSAILEARALFGRAALLGRAGEHAEARPLAERALALREQTLGPGHPATAASANQLGEVFYSMGDYEAARPPFQRALALREQTLGLEHPDTAASLNNLSVLLCYMGEYAAARPLAERALAILEQVHGPEHPSTATSLDTLALLLQALGEYAPARPLLERALATCEKILGPEHPDTATSVNNLAVLLHQMGEYASARPLYERAIAIRERALGPEHPETATSLDNLAALLDEMGEYAAARGLYERTLTVREALGPEHPETATCLDNLAGLFRSTGEYAAARRLYERALAIRERALGPRHPETALSLNNLALLLREQGDHAAARSLHERALAIRERALGPDHPGTAASLNNLALLLQAQGDLVPARRLFERSLAIRERALGPHHPSTALGLANLAGLLQDVGEHAAARPMYERALAIREQVLGPEHPSVAASLAALARLRAVQGEGAGALEQALEAERIGREHQRLTARSLSEREALRYAAVRPSGLGLALSLAAAGLEPAARWQVLDAVVRSRALVLDELAARHRASGPGDDRKTAGLHARLDSRRARLAHLVVRGPGREPEAYRELLSQARGEKEAAERALAAASAAFTRELSRGRLGADQVAHSLPAGSALVAFAQYGKLDLAPRPRESRKRAEKEPPAAYLALVLRAGARSPEVVDLGAAAAIDAAVARWKHEASGIRLLAGGRAEAEAAYREAGVALRRAMWDLPAAAAGHAERVFVVPDGSLSLVSVAALPLDDGGYLLERGPTLHYLSAERDLVPLGGDRRGAGLLALGGPNYDATAAFAALRGTAALEVAAGPRARARSAAYHGPRSACPDLATLRFEPLPATTKEALEVVTAWEKGRSPDEPSPADALHLGGDAAGEAALKDLAPGRRMLHLATHGFFLGGACESATGGTRGIGGLAAPPEVQGGTGSPAVNGENPLVLSGLALAGANHRASAGAGEEDGILTAEEIAALDLSGAEWVVLSACETGVGEVQAGEGVLGLRRAFEVAGAGTLIMSLWSVDDEATREWMGALYEGRLMRRLETSAALRGASLAVLERRRAAGLSTHPFYWGAFVAAGDWR